MRKSYWQHAKLHRKPAALSLQQYLSLGCLIFLVTGCASLSQSPTCPAGQVGSACIPADAIEDEQVARFFNLRTWVKPDDMEIDPIRFGMDVDIPIQDTAAKLIGPSQQDSVRSIAAKIWMIDNAEHSIDAGYYIFKRDLIGQAMVY